MPFFSVFLSVVVVVRDGADHLEETLTSVATTVAERVVDYELIVVANASDEPTIALLQHLTGEGGLPNLQVYVLTKEVDTDTASWVGIENALGDFVAVVDPATDSIAYLPEMLSRAVDGSDVVFARNRQKAAQGTAYTVAYALFNAFYKWFNGVHLQNDAPHYRMLSRRVVNFIQKHPQPAMTYRHLPATGGFSRVNLEYSAAPKIQQRKRIADSVDRGMRLMISTTRVPMRIVTTLSLVGAISNLLYSIYVIAVFVFKDNVAPGWMTLSLQQSGMFFLSSLVFLVLGEYILQMARLSNEGPLYHIAREFTSARMTRRERLNIEDPSSLLHTPGSGMQLRRQA
jgi:glycosyltransferase involved in cell wall biosynthesis